ncbi:MAG: NAD(P)H-dependent oxidoreductase [Nanoarchaeales archaeon]|nr:NAD(P)H-dependent oxidoreductase [Nanoarchaeales archaeon]
MTKNLLIIQTSLNSKGFTQKIAKYCEEHIKEKHSDKFNVEYINLLETENEFCNGGHLKDYSKETQQINKQVESADFYILATPVYNNGVSGVCKNFLDIHAKEMGKKYVALVENAGGIYSIKQPYNMLIQCFQYYKINLIDVVINTTGRSFDETGNLTDKIAMENLGRIITEFEKMAATHKSMPEAE